MTIRYRTMVLLLLYGSVTLAAEAASDVTGTDVEETVREIEEVVVTGTRGQPRSAADSAVPIDVFSSDDIESVSYTDTHNILQTLVPSYNVGREPISDGSTFIRPGTLRNLPSDKTLVLVNSKRRHRASLVVVGSSGTQGPDVATIPAAAIRSIEVLRDGAAAQYGSDAIAGVINFILKDNTDGFSLSMDTGEYYESDGMQTTVQANLGLPLGSDGFINLSGEFSDAEFTERAEQYCESWFCANPDSPRFDPSASYAGYLSDPEFLAGLSSASVEGDVVQPWGQPNTEAARFFYNAGLPLGDAGTELYSFGNYSQSKGDGGFFYRYPGNGTIEDLRLADGSVYNFLEIFPGGFTPRFEGEVEDYSSVLGVRGLFGEGGTWDLSARYGYNEISYTLENTVNPSLGPDTPTSFKPGNLSNEETQFQLDVAYPFEIGTASPLVLAAGLSYLDETYEVIEGELDSYVPGPFAQADPFGFCDGGVPTTAGAGVISVGSSLDCADSSDPVYQVVGVGSNGFPGYSPEFSDDYSRDSYGVYVDASTDITEKLFMQAAFRYEDYSDFGTETVWKLAGQFDVNENLGIRASLGTGFRAPTPGQQGTTNVSTRLPNGFPVATGLFPASSEVARALGASDLRAETSDNYTLGMTAQIGDLELTLDFYQIEIDDRVYAISTRTVASDPTGGSSYDNYLALVNAGVVGAESIGGVLYFTNAFDSETRGMDLVASYPIYWADGVTRLVASINYNESELASDASAFLNAEDQFDFENRDPNWRGVFTASHAWDRFMVLARLSYYGSYEDAQSSATNSQEYDSTVFFDLEGSMQVNEYLSVTIGGRNIFDTYPDKIDRSVGDYCCGRVYGSSSVVPWQGGYYFARLTASL